MICVVIIFRVLFSLFSGTSRFAEPVSTQQIRERNTNSIPKKTRDANKWALKVWSDWAVFRNSLPATTHEIGYPIPEDINALDDNMINYWGQRFIMEIKRQDGKDYPPNTLTQIVSGLQRYLTVVCQRPNINFFKEGTQFSDFRQCMDTRMKELIGQGIGLKTNSSDPVTVEDEIQFWEAGVFNFETAVGMSNAVFYYNGKLFGFRGFTEHINCQADQFEILFDASKELHYIKFTPGVRKNAQGGLKGRNVGNDPIIHYEQKDRKYSILDLYKKYLSLIPRIGAFYRKPTGGMDENNRPKFGAASIAQHAIKSMVKRFYVEAGIDTTNKNISNHSARVSLCTALYNNNFPDKAVKSRSKHKSNAVQTYQREQFKILNEISSALEPSVFKSQKNVSIPPATATSTVPNVSDPICTTTSTVVSTAESKIESKCEPKDKETKDKKTELKDDTHGENSLVITVPRCVNKIVILKNDGKKIILEI